MTTEEKLEHFMEVSMHAAAVKSQAMVDEYKAGMDKILEEHKAETLRKTELYKKTTADGLNRNSSKEFAKQQQHIKRKMTHKQDELREKLFKEVAVLMQEYKKSPEYDALLIKQIEGAKKIAKDQILEIYIDSSDEAKLETLKKATGVEIQISEYDMLGGVLGAIPERNILIDHSFSSGFAKAKEEFIIRL